MLEKILIPALATVLTVGISAFLPADDPPPKPSDGPPSWKKVEEAPAAKDVDADGLRDVYARLKKLRAEKLSDRPKALADDAARLYRRAIESHAAKDEARTRALVQATRELARALELSLGEKEDADDPALPPPPPAKGDVRADVVYRVVGPSDLPPPLPGGLRWESRFSGPSAFSPNVRFEKFAKSQDGPEPAKGEAREERVVVQGTDRIRLVKPDGGGESRREVIVEKLDAKDGKLTLRLREGDASAKAEAAKARDDAQKARAQAESLRKQVQETIEAHRKLLHEALQSKREQAREVEVLVRDARTKIAAEQADAEAARKTAEVELERFRRAEAEARLRESLAGRNFRGAQQDFRVWMSEREGGGKDAAIVELKKAYEVIQAARKEHADGEAKPYLDAARDLYNAARREAEAGRFDRAAGLSRAAESLTHVPGYLAQLRVEGGPRRGVIVRKPEARPSGTSGRADVRVEVETDDEERPEKGEAKKKAELDAERAGVPPIVGLGVKIAFEGGKAVISDLVPDGPAAKDGRLKKGDKIVGIETEDGATIGFGDKTMDDVTGLLRGPSGSKVKVLVQPSGSGDRKVFEIERQPLTVPKPPAPPGDGESKPEAAPLPPKLD